MTLSVCPHRNGKLCAIHNSPCADPRLYGASKCDYAPINQPTEGTPMKANTIDLRGNEQTATRVQAEEYAAYLGYELFMWLDTSHDVDPKKGDDFYEENPFYADINTYCDVCACWYPNDERCKFH